MEHSTSIFMSFVVKNFPSMKRPEQNRCHPTFIPNHLHVQGVDMRLYRGNAMGTVSLRSSSKAVNALNS